MVHPDVGFTQPQNSCEADRRYPYQSLAVANILRFKKSVLYAYAGQGAREVMAEVARRHPSLVIAPKGLHLSWRQLGYSRTICTPYYLRRNKMAPAKGTMVLIDFGVVSGNPNSQTAKALARFLGEATHYCVRREGTWRVVKAARSFD